MELKDEIRDYLDKTGENQSALALKAGVSPSTISRILAGKQGDVKGRNLKKIEAAISQDAHA